MDNGNGMYFVESVYVIMVVVECIWGFRLYNGYGCDISMDKSNRKLAIAGVKG